MMNRRRGLTPAELQYILDHDWGESDDDMPEDELENVVESLVAGESNLDQIRAEEEALFANFEDMEMLAIEGSTVEDGNVMDPFLPLQEEHCEITFDKIMPETLNWRRRTPTEPNTNWLHPSQTPKPVRSPTEYFREFFDADIIGKICEETNKYALQKDGIELHVTTHEIETYIGALLYMGIVKVPSMRAIWSQELRINAIADKMSRNRFEKIKKYFHLNDNTKAKPRDDPQFDKLFKVRPLIAKMKEKFNAIPPEEFNCVDEQMIPFKGRHECKQYVSKKSYPWGFKNFARAGISGIIYDFEFYVGTGTCPKYGISFSSDIVLHLCKSLPRDQNFKVVFDNWFTSISLLVALRTFGIWATGTIRSNRFGKNAYLKTESALKKKGRGSYDFKYETTHDIGLIRWYDNKFVHLASNYSFVEPEDTCRRWDGKNKRFIEVKRPNIVRHYNTNMGGVDLADMLGHLYRVNHRSTKWYRRIINWCINTSVNNAWLIYRRELKLEAPEQKNSMKLIDFQLSIAKGLMSGAEIVHPLKRGRPRKDDSSQLSITPSTRRTSTPTRLNESPHILESSSYSIITPSTSKQRRIYPQPDIQTRFDKVDHWPIHTEKSRCRSCVRGFTRIKCQKCNMA